MTITSQFCWHKASECQRLAKMSGGAQVQFFVKSRESWITIANHLVIVGNKPVAHEEAWHAILAAQRKTGAATFATSPFYL